MKLCVPLSDAFRLRQGELLPLVRGVSFKTPSSEWFPEKMLLLESSLNIGRPSFVPDLTESGLLNALRSGKYESFSVDIGPILQTRRGYSINGFPRAIPTGPGISRNEYIDQARRNVGWLRREFGGDLQAENLNYFATGGYEVVCETGFIRELVAATGIRLLLDIPHAMISARNLGYEGVMTYLRELPLDSVREIHLSHAGMRNEELEDLHDPPTAEELSVVRRLLLEGCNIRFLTVEYYRDSDVLVDTYRRIRDEMAPFVAVE